MEGFNQSYVNKEFNNIAIYWLKEHWIKMFTFWKTITFDMIFEAWFVSHSNFV